MYVYLHTLLPMTPRTSPRSPARAPGRASRASRGRTGYRWSAIGGAYLCKLSHRITLNYKSIIVCAASRRISPIHLVRIWISTLTYKSAIYLQALASQAPRANVAGRRRRPPARVVVGDLVRGARA